jgi:osmotically-inducible protein OsmY
MRRILVAVLMLMLISGMVFAQNKNTAKPKKPKMPAVDCSTVDDVTLAKNVNDRLAAAPSLKGQAITATADGGVVTLTGKVKTGGNKGTATRVAKAVKCVKSVTNNLEVEMKTAVPKGNKNGSTASKKKSNKNM